MAAVTRGRRLNALPRKNDRLTADRVDQIENVARSHIEHIVFTVAVDFVGKSDSVRTSFCWHSGCLRTPARHRVDRHDDAVMSNLFDRN